MSFVVAVDGPAGAGKGIVTKRVAEKLNFVYIDTGAMYRCVALQMLRKNIGLEDLEKVEEILETIEITLKKENGKDKVYLNNEDVSEAIRTEEVSNFTSPSSKIPIIRDKLTNMQRKMGNEMNVIMEGRDIGTTVFPNANVKIYLDAEVEERARRRLKQSIEKGIKTDFEAVLKDMKERDFRDSTREISPLKKADDAVYLDTTHLSIEEVVNKVIEIINNAK